MTSSPFTTTRAQFNTLMKIAEYGYTGGILFQVKEVPGLREDRMNDLVSAGLANRTRTAAGNYYSLNSSADPIINANN